MNHVPSSVMKNKLCKLKSSALITEKRRGISITASKENPLFKDSNQIDKCKILRRPLQSRNDTISAQKKVHLNNTVNQKASSISNMSNRVSKLSNRITSTVTKNSFHEQEYILSIAENYAREVGISALNIKTFEVFITQIIDNEAYVNSSTFN